MSSLRLLTRRRVAAAVSGLAGTAMVLSGLAVAAAPATATPPSLSGPTTSVSKGGSPAAVVAVEDTLDVAAESPVTTVGTVGHTVSQTWDNKGAVLSGSVTAPQGWTVEYRSGGSWSSSAPGDLTSVTGVRASTESFVSGGVDGSDHQITTSDAGGSLKAGSTSFSGSGGGDGWNVFFAGNKVLNVFHHNGSAYNLDCHKRADGSSCTGGSVYRVNGYVTSGASGGSVVGTKVYSIVGSATSAGAICTDVSTTPFTNCGYTPLKSGGFSSYQTIGGQAMSNGRVYAGLSTGDLVCFDTATEAACAGQPFALGGSYSPTSTVPAYAMAVEGKVFITANQVWCFDGATGAACAGSWPAGDNGWQAASVIPQRAVDGTLTGVCTIRPAGDCFDLAGAAASFPTGLSTLLGTSPASSMGSWSDFVAYTATKQYWISDGPTVCYDWTTDAACAGYSGADTGGDRYAVVVDPTDDNCLWTNGDSGVIRPVNGLTGALGCPAPADPVVVLPYSVVAPRLACADTPRVYSWESLQIDPPAAIDRSTMRVTVLDANGDAIPAYSDLTVPGDGVIDLSGLSVATSGQKPSLEMKAIGADPTDAVDVRAKIVYTAPAPQLCFPVEVVKDCPTLAAGQQAGDTVPVTDVAFAGASTTNASGTDTTGTSTTSVSRAAMAGCLGALSGTVAVSPSSGAIPQEGVTVQVTDGAATPTVHATATTDEDGFYRVRRLAPGTYHVRALGLDSTAVVVAGDDVDADLSVAVDEPVAHDVQITTMRTAAASAPVHVDVDAATTLDLETVQLFDPDDETWKTTVVVADEGTWTVTDTGSLRFTPLDSFVGTSTSISYRVSDGFGVGATAQVSAVVDDAPPSANPVTSTALRGTTHRIQPAGVAPSVPLRPESVRLVVGTGDDAEAVQLQVVDGVGTFTVDTEAGDVVFVPVGTFVGSRSVTYQVQDTLGRTASSTMTVTATAITVKASPVTVRAGSTAQSALTGVPGTATVTVPGTFAGASALAATRTKVTVTTRVTTSGILRVPVTVTNGTATIAVTAPVTVLPQAVKSGTYKVVLGGGQGAWTRSVSAVIGYRLLVNGKVVCTTSASGCTFKVAAGPRSTVTVVAVGKDGTLSTPTRLTYVKSATPAYLVDVFFASGSAQLDGKAQTTLKGAIAKIKAEGFTEATMIGYTDSDASASYNLALSKRRVNATGAYLKDRVGGLRTRAGALGESDPRADNTTAAGRAKNRRVEIRVS